MADRPIPAVNLSEAVELAEAPGDVVLARKFLVDALLEGEEQRAVRGRFFELMETESDFLFRSCSSGHLTASAIVIDRSREQTLLLEHKKLGRWLQPGGHADGDGNLAHVAWREASEETGIEGLEILLPAFDLDIHPISARGSEPAHLHYDVRFIVSAPNAVVPQPNHESTDHGWFDPTDSKVVGNQDIERVVGRAFTLLRALEKQS